MSFKWTPNFAYGVGLMTTDGCLSPDGRHLEFSSKDSENVRHLQRCFGIHTKIGHKIRGTTPYHSCYRTQFGNVELYRFLIGIGLTPRKSRTLRRVIVPSLLFADFLRGVWDGDGCITAFRHPESYRLQWRMHVTSGSGAFLGWLRYEIETRYGLTGTIFPNVRAQQLVYYKHQGARLIGMMYYGPDVVCLTRKRKKAEALLAGAENSPMWGKIRDSEGHVAKLEDATALGAVGETRGGSTPSVPSETLLVS